MPRLTIAEYAALSVRLAHVSALTANASAPNAGNASIARLLRDANLTETEWDAESSYWENELSEALEREEDVPQIVLDYSAAIQTAQNLLAGGPIALETFSQILGEVQRGTALDHALRQRQISLPEFLSAQRHWMAQAATEPAIRLALEAALR